MCCHAWASVLWFWSNSSEIYFVHFTGGSSSKIPPNKQSAPSSSVKRVESLDSHFKHSVGGISMGKGRPERDGTSELSVYSYFIVVRINLSYLWGSLHLAVDLRKELESPIHQVPAQWRNYGAAGPAAAGGPGKRGPKEPIFKPYRRDKELGAHFWDPAKGEIWSYATVPARPYHSMFTCLQ